MNTLNKISTSLFTKFLSEKTKEKSEKLIIYIAIISFVFHLLLIAFADLKWIKFDDFSGLLKNPMAAIYTPFSFILLYEAYLLVYYLPKSTTKYIGKQYEIITLIIIRRIFKDLYKLEFTNNWFSKKENVLFTLDVIAVLILFYLIYLFYRIVEINLHKKYQMNLQILSILKKLLQQY